VRAEETREVRFRAGAPGTYVYYADTDDPTNNNGDFQLGGVFIVDPPKPDPDERLFVFGLFDIPADATPADGRVRRQRQIVAVHGTADLIRRPIHFWSTARRRPRR
jgi:hypothetical protein